MRYSELNNGWLWPEPMIVRLDQLGTREKMIAEGCKYYCLNCHICYVHIPVEIYEDGHGGRLLNMCKCGSDLFAHLSDDSPVEGN
jgi:hypothetical protein